MQKTADYMDAAHELAAKVSAQADRISEDRQLPDELVNELADRGFFRLLVPESLGGAEMAHPDFIKIVEIFAKADASTAWCISQNNVFATDAARMPVETAREIWGEDRAVVTNGPPTRGTIAVPVEGGYRLSGRWNFSSGSNIATWIAARTPVKRSAGGSGHPGSSARMLLMPKSQVKMIDLWDVNGLRGTASFSFEVSDLFVPEDHSYDESDPAYEDGPLYVIPKIPLFALGFATIATALARSCLDDAIAMAGKKAPVGSKTLLRDESTTQRTLGESEAMLRSARAYLQQAGGEMWQEVCADGALSMDRRMEVRMATTHSIREAEKVVRAAYDLFGSDAIFTSNPIQQRFQDMSVITQHIQSRLANYETAGKYFLGLDPGTTL